MITAWAFIFGCIFCLMFLGMIYGERLSLVSVFEGRWLEPVGRIAGHVWGQLSEALDLGLLFVADHFSWVVATVSGSIGLFIVAFMMFSGMADDAAATHRDLTAQLNVGSVIDNVPQISVVNMNPNVMLASMEFDDSQIVAQERGSPYLVFNRPEFDRAPVYRPRLRDRLTNAEPLSSEELIPLERPVMGITFQRSEIRSLQFDDDRTSISTGRLIENSPLPEVINSAVRQLRLDDWKMTFRDRLLNPNPLGADALSGREMPLPESSAAALRSLESQVDIRIIPGDTVSENDLRIEKTVPLESSGQEMTVEISVLNVGVNTVDGLLVREFLPRNTRVILAEANGMLRDDTLTWLITDLRPFEERLLRFTVLADQSAAINGRRGRFESVTEASAVSAVSSRTVVRNDRRPVRPSSPVEDRSVIPAAEFTQRPDLRLVIEEPLTPIPMGDTIEVNFVVRNVGTAPAEGVGLRVTLDPGLKHHTLADDAVNREVVNGVRRLEPNETRTIVLRMRATRPGDLESRAEMIFQGTALTTDTFHVVAEQRTDSAPESTRLR